MTTAETRRKPTAAKAPPMRTGAQFLDAIRDDGRRVYFDGELVRDVTTHPAFCGAAKSLAHLFDVAADPANRELMTTYRVVRDEVAPLIEALRELETRYIPAAPEARAELYYAVRDEIRYNPFLDFSDAEAFRASAVLKAGQGFCIGKAALLAASARAGSINCVQVRRCEPYLFSANSIPRTVPGTPAAR